MNGTGTSWRVLLAFLLVNAGWGTTFLAIRLGVEDLPPALMAGVRFVIAGSVLALVALLLRRPFVRSRGDWAAVTITAFLMVVFGNGLVTWAEQWVPSNQAALIITTSALWLPWFGTFGRHGTPVGARTVVGLLIGFAGTVLMFMPGGDFSMAFFWAQFAILVSSVCWSAGAIYMRNTVLECSQMAFAAMQMFVGGVLLTVIGLAAGEASRWTWTVQGIGALLYLTVVGSGIAYLGYLWLLKRATPASLATTAYTVPIIATLVGWLMLSERLAGTQLVGMAVILAGVVIVTLSRNDAARAT